MSVTDSVPTFKARAAALGLAADVIDLFLDAKVDTLSKYAFCSSYVPGQANESEFLAALKAVMKRDATVGELSCLRRLLHEAYSMSAAELKQVVERTEDMPAKKLAQPERAHRLDTQQKRLTGFRIEGALEPADRLIDLVVQQYEENRVYHVDLHKCPSKEQEVLSQSSKEDRNITIDALGNVRVKGKDAKLEADLASDLLLRNAFTRRALAYDQANLVDFVKLNSWTERLLQSRLVDPPPGYARITQNQIIQADRKLWVKIAELTRDGVQLRATGRPIDLIFEQATEHPDVLHLLQPLPTGPAFQRTDRGDHKGNDNRFAPYRFDTPRKGKKGNGKGGGSSRVRMPAALEGGVPCTGRGNPLCFDFNIGGCSLPVTNQACRKGLHLCCFPKCFGHHKFADCPKRAASLKPAKE